MSEARTRIKICGITNREDLRAAVDYGADALGFILVPDSPRFVGEDLDFWERDFCEIPPFVSRVAVSLADFETDPKEVREFDAVQFYEYSGAIKQNDLLHWIRAFRVRDAGSLDEIEQLLQYRKPEAILLDTYHKDKLGGSGETFNWDLAVEAKRRFALPTILAGGLAPDNVGEAIATVRPYAVDVSSGVEAEPGRKDHAKLRAFIRAVREADRRLDS